MSATNEVTVTITTEELATLTDGLLMLLETAQHALPDDLEERYAHDPAAMAANATAVARWQHVLGIRRTLKSAQETANAT